MNTRHTYAAAAALLCIGLAGCGDTEQSAQPATTTAAASAAVTTTTPASATGNPSTAAGSDLRAKTCKDLLPFFNELRAADPAAVQKNAQNTIEWLPTRPEWAGLSEAERAASIAGVRDAAAGSCS
jgi:hypothetical protein